MATNRRASSPPAMPGTCAAARCSTTGVSPAGSSTKSRATRSGARRVPSCKVGSGVCPVDLEIASDEQNGWHLNGLHHPALAGCIDVDLNFSPSTNLLPIRRLDLGLGDAAEVRAAWLRFPSLTLEVLEQRYRRTGPTTYHYESLASGFACDLEVNDFGLVTHYPGFFVTAARD